MCMPMYMGNVEGCEWFASHKIYENIARHTQINYASQFEVMNMLTLISNILERISLKSIPKFDGIVYFH